MQASRFERLSFNPFALLEKGFVPAEVDIGGSDIVEALVEAPVIVVIDEGSDLSFEITGQEVVFQQDSVLQGLVPAFDLALGLRVIRRTARMLYAVIFQPFRQVARDIAGSVVTE